MNTKTYTIKGFINCNAAHVICPYNAHVVISMRGNKTIGTGNEDHELELVLLYMFATISFFLMHS